MKKVTMALMLFALCSCASNQIALTESFDETAAEKQIYKEGKNVIEGSAVWREKNGNIQKCSGYQVSLYPITKYAEERVNHLYGNLQRGAREAKKEKIVFVPDEIMFHKLSKKTICDVDGKFAFEDVADGDYFAVTKILWGNPEKPEEQTEGGNLMQKVSVKGGKKIKIVLSPYL